MKCNIQSDPVNDWEWSVGELVELREQKRVRIAPEYQRGEVWTPDQMRMLIDSMLRGYYIPLIYLHKQVYASKRAPSTHYNIVDGQQRINAMRSFIRGAIIRDTADGGVAERNFGALYDPRVDKSKFPFALHGQICPWAGKTFRDFSPEEQQAFLDTKIATAVIDCNDDEARDMFIRLQGGSDLRPQEKRDAWPGKFCRLVMELGGKADLRLPRHDFFTQIMRFRGSGDRGKSREMAAQMLMLFLLRKEKDADDLTFVSVGNEALNDAYRRHVGLDLQSPHVRQFREILDELVKAFVRGRGNYPPLAPYAAIHLTLFADSLLTARRERMADIAEAYGRFASEVETAKKYAELPEGRDETFREIWQFAEKTKGQGANDADNLRERHKIFTKQMWRLLGESPPAVRPYILTSQQQSDAAKYGTRPLERPQSSLEAWTVSELINERASGQLSPNPEYQRGAVWKPRQMQMLVDSVMRNYQIPLVYLHKIEEKGARGTHNVRLDIIDGQQRANALKNFRDVTIPPAGAQGNTHPFPSLFDPGKAPENRMFPDFQRGQKCPWGGKTYANLPTKLKEQFLNQKIAVVQVSCSDDIARDMFIRLQGGSPLTPQEVRDAWPGNFCQLVLEIGGKLSANYPGHPFIRTMVRRAGQDRGARRQLVAQLLALFLSRQERQQGLDGIVTVDQEKLDGVYRQRVELQLDSDGVQRFRKILDALETQCSRSGISPLRGHEVIHLVLLADTLMDNYTKNWEEKIVPAHEQFITELRAAQKAKKDGKKTENPEFLDYTAKAGANTPQGATIRRRHEIYVPAMFGFIGDSVKRKDPKRIYSEPQRREIFGRDNKLCYFCGNGVRWGDHHIHHLLPHSQGGQTTLGNGVLIHSDCHKDLHAQKREGDE